LKEIEDSKYSIVAVISRVYDLQKVVKDTIKIMENRKQKKGKKE